MLSAYHVTMSHSISEAIPNPANEPSARFFSGIAMENMRVLDVGCGNGDLSRYVARLVGPGGEVVGIDRSQDALAIARGVDGKPGAAPIRYAQADLAGELPGLGQFDAIVGRRVLMYLPDAAGTLDRLSRLANDGAIIAFQEHARAGLPAGLGELALHRQLYDWVWSTVAAEGGDVGLGLRLVDLLKAAGYIIEDARSEGILLLPGQPSFLPTLAEVMISRIVGCGVASSEEIGLDTLENRLEEERRLAGGTIVWDLAFLVSGRANTS